jgi:FKBP-type peptidyl-prolyl cis-trans isomerase FklB
MSDLKPNIMKKTILITLFCLSAAVPLLADGTNVLSDDKSRVSYAIGMSIGHNFQSQGIDIDDDVFLRGVKDEQAGRVTLLSQEEMRTVLMEFQKNFLAQQQVKNKTEGTAFLAANKIKLGVVTLPDGLQYLVITNGSGATPSPNDTVFVNYRGTFINGTEFDSSARAGHPVSFPVSGVIHGWTEALLQMKAGSKWQIFVPSDLAYGERGRAGIPPNSVLVFEVELLSVVPPPPISASPVVGGQSLTSDIIKVPSKAEMDKGAKIETIKPEDIQKYQSQSNTN